MNSNDLKSIPVGTSIHKETWDNCVNCHEHTPIGNMNLVTGRCSNCSKPKIRLTLEQMQKLCELDVGFK
jgi:hypothetical protein